MAVQSAGPKVPVGPKNFDGPKSEHSYLSKLLMLTYHNTENICMYIYTVRDDLLSTERESCENSTLFFLSVKLFADNDAKQLESVLRERGVGGCTT
jgi:hypothetical protein